MGLPLILAAILAVVFPYYCLALTAVSTPLLMILMFNVTVHSAWSFSRLKPHLRNPRLWIGLFFCFALIPSAFALMARLLRVEESLSMGLFWAALCPVALVAPSFARSRGADHELAHSFVMLSTLIAPLAFLIFPELFYPGRLSSGLISTQADLLLICSLPVFLGVAIHHVLFSKTPSLLKIFQSGIPVLNMILIGVLAYTYFGTALLKSNWNLLPWSEIAKISFLVLLLDFGVFAVFRSVWKHLGAPPQEGEALRISLAMKNVAISGAILTFADPRAAFASSLVFLVHGLFFSFLSVRLNPKHP